MRLLRPYLIKIEKYFCNRPRNDEESVSTKETLRRQGVPSLRGLQIGVNKFSRHRWYEAMALCLGYQRTDCRKTHFTKLNQSRICLRKPQLAIPV